MLNSKARIAIRKRISTRQNTKKNRKREMVMKHCFWQVNEISRRLHRLKSRGEFDGSHEKSQFIRKLKKDMIREKKVD